MITSPLSFFLKGSKAAFCFCKYRYQLFNFIFVFLPLLVKKNKRFCCWYTKNWPMLLFKMVYIFSRVKQHSQAEESKFSSTSGNFSIKTTINRSMYSFRERFSPVRSRKKWKGTNYCKVITFLYGANVEHTYYINPFAPGNFAANFARVVQPKKFT